MAIPAVECQYRMARLQQSVAAEGLDLFLVSAEESILYLTGVSYTPLERPFFILVRPRREPELLVPTLERYHLAQAAFVHQEQTYWDYPSPAGQGWAERLDERIGLAPALAVEPTLPAEVLHVLDGRYPAILPLVERLRLVKSPAEIDMLRHADRFADLGVERALNGFLRQEGYGDHLLHRTGHGIGLGTHEGPWVADGSGDRLAPGMLVGIEPGIYLPGVGGIRHSDTVLVTEDGPESLTRYPTDLDSLILRGARLWPKVVGAVTRRVAGIEAA